MSRYQEDLLPRVLCAVLQTRSVPFRRWVPVVGSSTQIDRTYRRIQRFFNGTWSPQVATQLTVQQLVKTHKTI